MRFCGLIVVAVISISLFACSKDTSDVDDQRVSIENYISRQGWENVDYLGGVYRYVLNQNRPGYEDAMRAGTGDKVVINYTVYQFSSSSTGGLGTLIYTNNPEVQNEQEGLDPAYWAKEPWEVTLGSTPLISGLELGLNGVRQGDTLQLFMSSDKRNTKSGYFRRGSISPKIFMRKSVPSTRALNCVCNIIMAGRCSSPSL